MALLQAYINSAWVDLPNPDQDNYATTYTNLENSYINANGELIREIIRRNRAKVFCGWSVLNAADMEFLQSLYDEDSFLLRFTDNNNDRVEKTVYAGPLEGKATMMNGNDFTITYRTSVQMNFIEV